MSEERKQRLEEFGRWVKFTCDHLGASPHTGYLVAGVLMEGLTAEWEKRDAERRVAA